MHDVNKSSIKLDISNAFFKDRAKDASKDCNNFLIVDNNCIKFNNKNSNTSSNKNFYNNININKNMLSNSKYNTINEDFSNTKSINSKWPYYTVNSDSTAYKTIYFKSNNPKNNIRLNKHNNLALKSNKNTVVNSSINKYHNNACNNVLYQNKDKLIFNNNTFHSTIKSIENNKLIRVSNYKNQILINKLNNIDNKSCLTFEDSNTTIDHLSKGLCHNTINTNPGKDYNIKDILDTYNTIENENSYEQKKNFNIFLNKNFVSKKGDKCSHNILPINNEFKFLEIKAFLKQSNISNLINEHKDINKSIKVKANKNCCIDINKKLISNITKNNTINLKKIENKNIILKNNNNNNNNIFLNEKNNNSNIILFNNNTYNLSNNLKRNTVFENYNNNNNNNRQSIYLKNNITKINNLISPNIAYNNNIQYFKENFKTNLLKKIFNKKSFGNAIKENKNIIKNKIDNDIKDLSKDMLDSYMVFNKDNFCMCNNIQTPKRKQNNNNLVTITSLKKHTNNLTRNKIDSNYKLPSYSKESNLNHSVVISNKSSNNNLNKLDNSKLKLLNKKSKKNYKKCNDKNANKIKTSKLNNIFQIKKQFNLTFDINKKNMLNSTSIKNNYYNLNTNNSINNTITNTNYNQSSVISIDNNNNINNYNLKINCADSKKNQNIKLLESNVLNDSTLKIQVKLNQLNKNNNITKIYNKSRFKDSSRFKENKINNNFTKSKESCISNLINTNSKIFTNKDNNKSISNISSSNNSSLSATNQIIKINDNNNNNKKFYNLIKDYEIVHSNVYKKSINNNAKDIANNKTYSSKKLFDFINNRFYKRGSCLVKFKDIKEHLLDNNKSSALSVVKRNYSQSINKYTSSKSKTKKTSQYKDVNLNLHLMSKDIRVEFGKLRRYRSNNIKDTNSFKNLKEPNLNDIFIEKNKLNLNKLLKYSNENKFLNPFKVKKLVKSKLYSVNIEKQFKETKNLIYNKNAKLSLKIIDNFISKFDKNLFVSDNKYYRKVLVIVDNSYVISNLNCIKYTFVDVPKEEVRHIN